MTSSVINRLSVFTIGKDDRDWAVYTRGQTFEVGSAEEAEEILDAVRAGTRQLGTLAHSQNQSRPERYLDIEERDGRGVCLYAFQLDAYHEGKQRLRFVNRRPFIPLPLNSSWRERFLFDSKGWSNGVMASFRCDLDKVRRSRLAEQIRTLNRGSGGHGHPDILNIPFTFNVRDPEFKSSPWVVPGHSPSRTSDDDPTQTHGQEHSHGQKHYRRRTHGGVHPTTVAFLSVEV